jgi:hypothetical protein
LAALALSGCSVVAFMLLIFNQNKPVPDNMVLPQPMFTHLAFIVSAIGSKLGDLSCTKII